MVSDGRITVVRLTTIVSVIRLWDFFVEGIEYESKYLRYDHSIDTYRKIIYTLVRRNPNAWVGVAFAGTGTPLGFVLAHDCTPLFAEKREFEISMFYYRLGYKPALVELQREFESFCQDNQVTRFYVSTTSKCSAADRVFKGSWQGLERCNTIFKKELLTS